MTARLARLRIAGFKSFAEPVSLDILPGLTGIVGPNGCGKSNVVEALRWAMGETSARSLRGGEMDDVIFSGTTARASRNLAEVTITLEPGADRLPSPFEAEGELQVTRRIERGAGSAFRANGRELRARDVQTLYADLASGARSSGMVSQGRVADLVRARPEERRQVLEEAAGITGLHARRHEAELKLRAAEQNLARSDDLRTQLDAARDSLRRQARQAARYRTISGLIRDAEAEHLAVLHGQAATRLERARSAVARTEAAAQAAEAEQQTASDALSDAEAALPGPRQAEAEARSILERRRVEAETLAEEAARVREASAQGEARLLELEADLAAAGRAKGDAGASVTRLAAERDRLAARVAELPVFVAAARTQADVACAGREAAQRAADLAADRAAAASAACDHAEAARQEAAGRVDRLRARHAAAVAEREACEATRIAPDRLANAVAAVARAETEAAAARATLDTAERARASATEAAFEAETDAARQRAAHEAAARHLDAAATRAAQLWRVADAAAASLAALRQARIDPDELRVMQEAAEAATAALDRAESRIEMAEHAAAAAQAAAAAARRVSAETGERALRAQAEDDDAQARAARLADEVAALEAERDRVVAAAPSADALANSQAAAVAAGLAESEARLAMSDGEAARATAVRALATARDRLAEAEAEAARLRAEAEGLRGALGEDAGEQGALSQLRVPEGLEAAVGAALGEAGRASLDPAAPRFWRALPLLADTDVPIHCTALAKLLWAPDALARALGRVALLDEGADGFDVQAALAPGTVVVDRAGACWRWDGHVTRPGAPNPTGSRLAQLRRLAMAESGLATADAAASDARIARDAAGRSEIEAVARAEMARAALMAAQAALQAAGQQERRLRDDAGQAADRQAGLDQMLARLLVDRAAADEAASRARAARDGLPATADVEAARRVAEAAAQEAALALEMARADRVAARARATQARDAAQSCASAAARDAALIEAAEPALARAIADHAAAGRDKAVAQAALDGLPNPAMQVEAARFAVLHEEAARATETEARLARQAADAALDAARLAETRLRAAHETAETGFSALHGVALRTEADLAEGERQAAETARLAACLPDPAALAAEAQSARHVAEVARQEDNAAAQHLRALDEEIAQAGRTMAGLSDELSAWQVRLDEAVARQVALEGRRDAARAAWSALAARPADMDAKAARSGQALAAAEAAHAEAAARLVAAEGRVRALALAERDAARAAGACREQLTRDAAACEACQGALQAVLARALDRLGADGTLPEIRDVSDLAEDRARKKFERLTREREEMGPVNLRAELELDELDTRIGALEAERAELGTAIAKLRGAIGHLNREGRERLQAVFAQVDQHFRTLFTRMMGGGRAHLALTGSTDPLEAGLEIYAEPPGKKLSALSLLSGGEQALTALSLIFAVFRCTPAPLCVLDEVDAPLDDANVGRFCTLLDDVVRDTGTSFLVVTHHQLTMSRMDRLYGVTMQERGVSRLLSVDFSRAAAMVEPVLQAAE